MFRLNICQGTKQDTQQIRGSHGLMKSFEKKILLQQKSSQTNNCRKLQRKKSLKYIVNKNNKNNIHGIKNTKIGLDLYKQSVQTSLVHHLTSNKRRGQALENQNRRNKKQNIYHHSSTNDTHNMTHFNSQGGCKYIQCKYKKPYTHPFDNSIQNQNNPPNPYDHRLTYIQKPVQDVNIRCMNQLYINSGGLNIIQPRKFVNIGSNHFRQHKKSQFIPIKQIKSLQQLQIKQKNNAFQNAYEPHKFYQQNANVKNFNQKKLIKKDIINLLNSTQFESHKPLDSIRQSYINIQYSKCSTQSEVSEISKSNNKLRISGQKVQQSNIRNNNNRQSELTRPSLTAEQYLKQSHNNFTKKYQKVRFSKNSRDSAQQRDTFDCNQDKDFIFNPSIQQIIHLTQMANKSSFAYEQLKKTKKLTSLYIDEAESLVISEGQQTEQQISQLQLISSIRDTLRTRQRLFS